MYIEYSSPFFPAYPKISKKKKSQNDDEEKSNCRFRDKSKLRLCSDLIGLDFIYSLSRVFVK